MKPDSNFLDLLAQEQFPQRPLPKDLHKWLSPIRSSISDSWGNLTISPALSYQKNSQFIDDSLLLASHQTQELLWDESPLDIRTSQDFSLQIEIQENTTKVNGWKQNHSPDNLDLLFCDGTRVETSSHFSWDTFHKFWKDQDLKTLHIQDRLVASSFLNFHRLIYLVLPIKNLDKPISLIFNAPKTKVLQSTLLLIHVPPHSKNSVFIQYQQEKGPKKQGVSLISIVSSVEPEAHCAFYESFKNGTQALVYHVSQVAQNATLDHFHVGHPEKARISYDFSLKGRGAQLNSRGVFLGHKHQFLYLELFQRHLASKTQSNSLYKGLLKDNALATFQGLIQIEDKAQNCDAYLDNKNLLLNDGARVNAIPMLEIENNDVSCSHGSTTSQLDEQSIFYLCSRGLSLEQACDLLTESFLFELVQTMPLVIQKNVAQNLLW